MTNTIITSVSVSKEFQDILEKHKFSPTEVFRRGIAVMCYDIGLLNYQTDLNESRSKYVEDFMKKIKEQENLIDLEVKVELIKKNKQEIIKLSNELIHLLNDFKMDIEEIKK